MDKGIVNFVMAARWSVYCVLAIAVAFILTSCNGDSATSGPPTPEAESTEATATSEPTPTSTPEPASTPEPQLDPIDVDDWQTLHTQLPVDEHECLLVGLSEGRAIELFDRSGEAAAEELHAIANCLSEETVKRMALGLRQDQFGLSPETTACLADRLELSNRASFILGYSFLRFETGVRGQVDEEELSRRAITDLRSAHLCFSKDEWTERYSRIRVLDLEDIDLDVLRCFVEELGPQEFNALLMSLAIVAPPDLTSTLTASAAKCELDLEAMLGQLYQPSTSIAPVPEQEVGVAYSWTTEAVEFSADSIVIGIGDREFQPVLDTLEVSGDPGDEDSSTLELTWFDGVIEMRLYMYFKADATRWWSDQVRNYDGHVDGEWVDYRYGRSFEERLFGHPLGSPYQGDIALHSVSDDGQPAELKMSGVRIKPFAYYKEGAGLEDSLIGLLMAMGKTVGRYYGPGWPENKSWANLDARDVAQIHEGDISGEWTCGDLTPVVEFLERNAQWAIHEAPQSFMDEIERIQTWDVEVSDGTGRIVSNLGPGFEIFQGDFVLEDNYWRWVPDFIEGCSRR